MPSTSSIWARVWDGASIYAKDAEVEWGRRWGREKEDEGAGQTHGGENANQRVSAGEGICVCTCACI